MPFAARVDTINLPAALFSGEPGDDDLVVFRETEIQDRHRWSQQWLTRLLEHDDDDDAMEEAAWPWRKHIQAAATEEARLCLALARGDTLEALISLTHGEEFSRFAPGAQMVYVEYVCSAPWYRFGDPPPRKLYGLGKFLLRASVQLSVDLKFDGRVGLHSKPKVEDYYRKLGFTEGKREATEDGTWLYFELQKQERDRFLAGGRE
jgi:hypothetical protein